MDFCETQAVAFPALADKYNAFSEDYSKKLWHQLSEKLAAFLSDPATLIGNNWQVLYSGFIKNVEARLNPVVLASLVSRIGHSVADPAQSLALFQEVLQARTRLGAEAAHCLDMDVVLVRLRLGEVSAAKAALEEGQARLPSLPQGETLVFSKYYKAAAEYRKLAGPPQEFYKAGLMFLAYTPLEDLAAGEAAALAADLALASVTGDDIFNFGEVLATPILGCLAGSPSAWLRDLVLALHHGSVAEFRAVVDAHRAAYFATPALAAAHEAVEKKVVLLALVDIAFERGSNDRVIKFSDIAARTAVPLQQVEWALMSAMSKGLVKGRIDQVDQSVDITWVQPRILDKAQAGVVAAQLDGWAARVKDATVTVEEQTAELLC